MRLRCPYCFDELGSAPRAFRCDNPECRDEPDPIASAHYGSPVATKAVTTLATPPRQPVVGCRRCNRTTTTIACPACHAPLAPNWYQFATTCIAMSGARASGKSIYIAVVKHQADKLCQMMGRSLDFFDEVTRRTYSRVYETPLYEQRGLIAPTARHETPSATQKTPLMFSLGMIKDKPHVLVVRDVAGENLEDPAADPTVFSFFRRADGVLFLFDPMRVNEIRQHLTGRIAEQSAVGGDPVTVLGTLERLMKPALERVPTPLAVVLAKFDTLQELGGVAGSAWQPPMTNAGAAYSRDPSLEWPSYSEPDGRLLDAEVRSLLTRMNATGLLNRIAQNFADTRMFAVSALGAAPTGPALHARGIAPFRCLDPLKWIMAKTGALDGG